MTSRTIGWNEIGCFVAGGVTAVAGIAAYRAYSGRIIKKAAQQSKPWQVGQNQPLPFQSGNWKAYSADELKASGGAYSLLISTVVPRPIALISSQSAAGVVNCAPYSYFNAVCHDPPLIVVGINTNARLGTKKDSLRNIEETGQFVVNIMSSWYLESANHCSGNFKYGEDETEFAGLTKVPSEVVKAPRVGEAAVQFECEVVDVQPRHNDKNVHTVSVVTARIVRFHVHEGVLTDASLAQAGESCKPAKPVVDWHKLMPVGRLGGDFYTVVDNSIEIERPKESILYDAKRSSP